MWEDIISFMKIWKIAMIPKGGTIGTLCMCVHVFIYTYMGV